MNFNSKKETADKKERQGADEATKLQDEQVNASEENSVSDNVTDEGPEQKELEELKKKYDELNDSHLRLMAEFDNYRKRTMKEKAELIKNGGEKAISAILPILDDLERALQNMQKADNVQSMYEGLDLIFQKFHKVLAQEGLQKMEPVGETFDTDYHEAIALVPASSEDQKGKILDCVQTGYKLNEKVIRHAKVVVAQ